MNSRSVSRIHYDSTIFFFYQIVCIGYYMSYSGSTDATEVLDMYNARYDWFSLLLKYIYRRVFKSFSSRDWSGDWYSFRVVERWRIGALAPPKFTLCTLLHNYSLLIFHEGYLIFPPLRWGLNDNQTYDIICNIISKSVLSPVPQYYALFLSSGLIFSLPRLRLSAWRWTLYLIFSHIPLRLLKLGSISFAIKNIFPSFFDSPIKHSILHFLSDTKFFLWWQPYS